MSRISMVFQDVYLFQDTIRDNIRFGKPGATDEEIIAAARKPAATISSCACRRDTTRWWAKAVARSPAARSSHIHRPCHTEGCADRSAGRSTASLDPEWRGGGAEGHRHTYQGTHRHRHRPQTRTIMNPDRIVVLEDGRVKEQGMHDELMRHEGFRRRLWTIQEKSAGWTV